MNKHLQNISDSILQNDKLTSEQKELLLKSLKTADKELEIINFKLDRTEKVKKTTAILLEETIEELEQKRKAVEAQNKELEIEAALEKVRSSSLAMNRSDELWEVIAVVFEKLQELNFSIDGAAFIMTFTEGSKDLNLWLADDHGQLYPSSLKLEYYDSPVINDFWRAKESGLEFFTKTYSFEEKNHWLRFAFEHTDIKILTHELKSWILDQPCLTQPFALGKNSLIGIHYHYQKVLSDTEVDILKRFSKVFDQAYIRFLDLQKAETQGREAQIQLALERLRARTMAMHNSSELSEVATLLFDQLSRLGVELWSCGFTVCKENSDIVERWMSLPNGEMLVPLQVPLSSGYGEDILYNVWKDKVELFTYIAEGEEVHEGFENLKSHPSTQIIYQRIVEIGVQFPTWIQHFVASFRQGYLWVMAKKAFEETDIFKRFAKVFEQTYTRFLDLQKAEAQAREAQIEAALERVRSKTMAMHSSDDVGDTVATMFNEFVRLGIQTNRCGILIFSDEPVAEVWTAKSNPEGKANLIIGKLDLTVHALLHGIYKAWKKNETFYNYIMEGNDLKNYYQALNGLEYYPVKFDLNALPLKEFHSDYYFPEGSVFAFTGEPVSEEHKKIIKRFAGVFGQTYRRYLDLQKAEMQAREATIEAALEKVRGKAMAMHNSHDLSATASLVFTELRKLGITPIRCGVGLLNKDSRRGQLYSATSSADGDSLSLVGWVQLERHPVLEKIYDKWLMHEDYFPELAGEQLRRYYELLLSGLAVTVPDTSDGTKQYGHFLSFSVGCLYAWSQTPYNDAELKILKRFASIIDLTFRRYIELQTSEANAKEAVKQAALDRIRADIASMRTVTDLERITPVIWNELTILGVPFIRSGVFIMDEGQQLIHTFLSTPDGKAIGAFHLPYNTPGNIEKVLNNWKLRKNYIVHWNEQDFMEFGGILAKQGALSSAEHYLKTIPHGGFHLHFLPFLQGMLYVGNTTQLSNDEIKLIQSIADAFSTAYARYEDFNKLEAAKRQVDKTLADLKQAQQQLVQSEKMASLGELTAGIAHEIQNPLNFVNNFSDVNKELLEELIEEAKKGNIDEVKAIAGDVISNEEKINHHGKRADSIVKGMLQHSQRSTGEKIATDINALADEYLRLAYHGIRAKDKSFNAKLETDFDAQIGRINIIPQDIGRVVLNILTNAFYAVNEKKKISDENYHPTVLIRTKKINDTIEIVVSDNGNGIPKNIVDKIFQPFFTTKPTGQGTGLGLSLAYDIVKAHGGEIKVETKEGEGTFFLIKLPVN